MGPKWPWEALTGHFWPFFERFCPCPSLPDRKMKKSGPTRRSTLRATSGATVNADVGHKKMKTIIALIFMAFWDTSPALGIFLDGKAILNQCKSNTLARQQAAYIGAYIKEPQATLTNTLYQCVWTPWSSIFLEVIPAPSAPPCH